jgi:hypothetical protein
VDYRVLPAAMPRSFCRSTLNIGPATILVLVELDGVKNNVFKLL